MKKVKVFGSYSQYETWADQFEEPVDFCGIPVLIESEKKISADVEIYCKKPQTAVRRFAKTFSRWEVIRMWAEESISESLERGIDQDSFSDGEHHYSWGVYEVSDGIFYVFLNLSGCYAEK